MGATRGNKGTSPMLRIIWALACLALAFLTLFVELDRQSRRDPAFARLVPRWIASFALAEDVTTALRDDRAQDALEGARDLVAVRPVPAENLTMLALAADANGDADLATRAIGEAAMRGWREPVAQVSVMEAAVAQGEWAIATQRLDALRRTGQPAEISDNALKAIGQNADGRKELARRLAEPAPWADDFLRRGPRLLAPGEFAEVLSGSEKLGARFDCARLAASAVEVLRKGQPAAARAVWHGECARAAAARAASSGFNGLDEAGLSPFAWSYPRAAGLFRIADKTGGSTRLNWSNSSVLDRRLAERYFDLSSGPHGIDVQSPQGASLIESGDMSVEVMCFSPTDAQSVTRRVPVSHDGRFMVPQDCPVQRIGLDVDGGKGVAGRVVISP